jgi:hypothetical protein
MADEDLSERECKVSDEHYWVDSDEVRPHCRRKPNQ